MRTGIGLARNKKKSLPSMNPILAGVTDHQQIHKYVCTIISHDNSDCWEKTEKEKAVDVGRLCCFICFFFFTFECR